MMNNILRTREKGNLIVISGPSGAGKGTIISKILESNDNVWLSVSVLPHCEHTRECRKRKTGDSCCCSRDDGHYPRRGDRQYQERKKTVAP